MTGTVCDSRYSKGSGSKAWRRISPKYVAGISALSRHILVLITILLLSSEWLIAAASAISHRKLELTILSGRDVHTKHSPLPCNTARMG